MGDKAKWLAEQQRIADNLEQAPAKPRPQSVRCTFCHELGVWQIGNQIYCREHIPDEERAAAGLPVFAKGDGHTPWIWVWCLDLKCGYRRALPLVPYMIRFQTNNPLPRLKNCLVCRCGKRGATFQRPSPTRENTMSPWWQEQFPHNGSR